MTSIAISLAPFTKYTQMKRKPDLMLVLFLMVGFGVAISAGAALI